MKCRVKASLSFNSHAFNPNHNLCIFQLVWTQNFSCLLGVSADTPKLLPLPWAPETRPDASKHRIKTLTTKPVLAFRMLGFWLHI